MITVNEVILVFNFNDIIQLMQNILFKFGVDKMPNNFPVKLRIRKAISMHDQISLPLEGVSMLEEPPVFPMSTGFGNLEIL